MKPAWDKLMTTFENDAALLIADVDCTGAGKKLCTQHHVRGYPTIKYGSPTALQDYKGGRKFEDLERHAQNVKSGNVPPEAPRGSKAPPNVKRDQEKARTPWGKGKAKAPGKASDKDLGAKFNPFASAKDAVGSKKPPFEGKKPGKKPDRKLGKRPKGEGMPKPKTSGFPFGSGKGPKKDGKKDGKKTVPPFMFGQGKGKRNDL